jgi:metallophosphoesterase (TIGR00282 family)
MNLLFIGDIVGRPGREIVRRGLGAIVSAHAIDLVIANGENAAAGFGITREIGDALFGYGIHVMTSGNHIWDKKEALDYIVRETRLLRPANYPAGAPGTGAALFRSTSGVAVGVVNVMGRVYLANIDDPFTTASREIARLKAEGAQVIFVDVHAEVTSEKIAMGWYLDGKISALVGTHTHVQTADERILPQGTAYISDVGMTGPRDGVIGMDRARILERFQTGLPVRFEVATGPAQLNAVAIDVDEETGMARRIERILEVDGRTD